jgi:hypothetical protein
MNAKTSFSAKPRERQFIGYLEDYWTFLPDGFFTTYAGNRMVRESAQAIGS